MLVDRALGALASLGMLGALAACSPALALRSPDIAGAAARSPTPVDVEPLVTGAAVAGGFTHPSPAEALTAAMDAELQGRALHGGAAGGYAARCTLDRFAVRTGESVTESLELLVLYVDLSCAVFRLPVLHPGQGAEAPALAGPPAFRGELRARTCSEAPNLLGSDVNVRQRLLDRALSDAARELASDLAIRALGLAAQPSARSFADEEQQRATAGLDDTPFGPTALQETAATSESVRRALNDPSPRLRAAAWNAAAMAAGPGDEWTFGGSLSLDDDRAVRFAQYKALARLAAPAALDQLRAAAVRENEPLLSELIKDALATGGTGLRRVAPADAGRAPPP